MFPINSRPFEQEGDQIPGDDRHHHSPDKVEIQYRLPVEDLWGNDWESRMSVMILARRGREHSPQRFPATERNSAIVNHRGESLREEHSLG